MIQPLGRRQEESSRGGLAQRKVGAWNLRSAHDSQHPNDKASEGEQTDFGLLTGNMEPGRQQSNVSKLQQGSYFQSLILCDSNHWSREKVA